MDARGRARCPYCGRRRVLRAHPLDDTGAMLCQSCTALVSYVTFTSAMAWMDEFLRNPGPVLSEINDIGASFTDVIRATKGDGPPKGA